MSQAKFDFKEIVLSQLDLIKQQSEDIVKKDKRLRDLQKENEKLRQRLRQLGNSVNNTNTKAKRIGSDERRQKVQAVEDKAIVTDIRDVVVPLRVTQEQEKQDIFKKTEKECFERKQDVQFLTTEVPYFVQRGEDIVAAEREEIANILRFSDVPGFRAKPQIGRASYQMEGTENIEDDEIAKRHAKLEADEKRRKRWDMQRLREQRNIQRLKARYLSNSGGSDQVSNGQSPTNGVLTSFWPSADSVAHIEVSDQLPVAGFGYVCPRLRQRPFRLPWNAKQIE